MTFYLVVIVEGQTEDASVERLIHRVWNGLLARHERLQILEILRRPRSGLVHPDGRLLASQVDIAATKLAVRSKRDPAACPLILILLDAEGDCPAQLGRAILQTATEARADMPIACVFAKAMFENWIVAGASTLGGLLGLPNPIPARRDVEGLNGASWLDRQMRSNRANEKYRKLEYGPDLVQAMNLAEARANSPSFDKLCRELAKLIPPPTDPGAGEPPPPPSTSVTPVSPPAL